MTTPSTTAPVDAKAAVLVHSAPISPDAISVVGPDLSTVPDIKSFLAAYQRIGFQATSLSNAVDIVQNMVRVLLGTRRRSYLLAKMATLRRATPRRASR